MRIILATAPLAAATSSPAPTRSRPVHRALVEGIVGWDRNQSDIGQADGIVYGGAVGYDFNLGGAVAGIEAEATDSSADTCGHDVTVTGDRLCVGAKRDLYVGGRIGAVVGGNNLIYAKAGYTNARFGYDYDDGGDGTTPITAPVATWTASVSALASSISSAATPTSRRSIAGPNHEQGVEKHQAVAGFGYRF